MTSKTLASAWALMALLLAAGCSDPGRGSCAELTCGENATCDEGSLSCACAPGFSGNPQAGCVADIACTAESCSGHGTCRVVEGETLCSCDLGFAGEICDGCAEGYSPENGECLSHKMVPCRDTAPENANAVVVAVQIAFESGVWNEAAECEWACATGFALEAEACINSKQVACLVPATLPANAHSVAAQVTVTYTDAGWSTAGTCAIECAPNYALEAGACIDSKQVACAEPATIPANAHSVAAQVTVTYSDAGWSTVGTCAVECDTDYALEAGFCINSKQVGCIAPATLPANAHSVAAQVTVTYTDAGWTTAGTCAVECDPNYTLEAGTCINSKQVACLVPVTLPANAHSVAAQVTVTYTDAGWSTAATCAIECEANYALEAGACIDSKQVACAEPATIPANAHSVATLVTVTYTTAGDWTETATCALECDANFIPLPQSPLACVADPCLPTNPCGANGTCSMVADSTYDCACIANYTFEAGTCIDSKQVDCLVPATLPANAHSVTAQVEVTWDGTQWSAPAACAWNCDGGYDRVAGACLNTQSVPCTDVAPANATSTATQVTIDYVGGVWETAANCAWTCNPGLRERAGECVQNQDPVMDPVIDAVTMDEGQTRTVTLTATDPDDDTLTYTLAAGAPAFASVSGSTLTLAPDYAAAGTYSVTVQVSDGQSGAATGTLDVNVTDVNRAPTLDEPPAVALFEGETQTVALPAADPDGDTLTYSLEAGVPGWITIQPDTGVVTLASRIGDANDYSITVIVSDGSLTDTRAVPVTVARLVCTSTTLAAEPWSDTVAHLDAQADCGGAPAEYRFLVEAPGATTLSEIRTWGPNAFDFDLAGYPGGQQLFRVDARRVGSPDASEASVTAAYSFDFASVALTLSTSVFSTFTLSASPADGPPYPEFQFFVREPGSPSFVTLFPGTSLLSTVTWSNLGKPSGLYVFRVYTRAAGSQAPWEAYAFTTWDQPAVETNCTNGMDDDGNGAPDCADSACAGSCRMAVVERDGWGYCSDPLMVMQFLEGDCLRVEPGPGGEARSKTATCFKDALGKWNVHVYHFLDDNCTVAGRSYDELADMRCKTDAVEGRGAVFQCVDTLPAECSVASCDGGGMCIPGTPHATCSCPPGTTGPWCGPDPATEAVDIAVYDLADGMCASPTMVFSRMPEGTCAALPDGSAVRVFCRGVQPYVQSYSDAACTTAYSYTYSVATERCHQKAGIRLTYKCDDACTSFGECENDGHCQVNSGGNPVCRCVDGWTGQHCEIPPV